MASSSGCSVPTSEYTASHMTPEAKVEVWRSGTSHPTPYHGASLGSIYLTKCSLGRYPIPQSLLEWGPGHSGETTVRWRCFSLYGKSNHIEGPAEKFLLSQKSLSHFQSKEVGISKLFIQNIGYFGGWRKPPELHLACHVKRKERQRYVCNWNSIFPSIVLTVSCFKSDCRVASSICEDKSSRLIPETIAFYEICYFSYSCKAHPQNVACK